MREIRFRSDDYSSSEAMHDGLAKAMGFPAHYGKNLDALWDCLGEMKVPVRLIWEEEPETSVTTGQSKGNLQEQARKETAASILNVLQEFSIEEPGFHLIVRKGSSQTGS